MKSEHDLQMQQSSSARAQQVLFCEISKINSPGLFPLHSLNCNKIKFPKSDGKQHEILIENSIQQLKYVIQTISQQDQEIAFDLQEIIDQSVRLAQIDIQKQKKYETTQTAKKSSRYGERLNAGGDEKAVNRTYIGDQIPRLEINKRNGGHNVSINDMPRLNTGVSSINLISGEKKGKENVFGQRKVSSSRPTSANKKPVNFMNKMQSHIDKNNQGNTSMSSNTRDITTFESNYQTAQDQKSMINLKPPMPKYNDYQNQTQIIDSDSFLAPPREDKYGNQTLIEGYHPTKQVKTKKKIKSSRSPLPAQDSVEDDFRMLIKYMKMWKKYIKIKKIEKVQKKKDVAKMMKAIHYYEKMTLLNCMQAFRTSTHKQQIFRNITSQIEAKVNSNLRVFYFKLYRKMYMREQKRKYMRKVAKSYFFEQRRFKCLKCWKTVTDRESNQRETCFNQIRTKVPYSAEIILEIMIGSFFIKNIQFSEECMTDIVKFHFYAIQHCDTNKEEFKRIRNIDRFNFSVEFVLQQKQARVFRCLLRNRQNQQNFRKMIGLNIKRKVFSYMKGQQYIKNEMVVLEFKRHERAIRIAFESLSLNSYRRVVNRQKFEVLQYQTSKKLTERLLNEWQQLYAYYSPFTTSQCNYSTAKQSQLQFKSPFFNKLKSYYLMRKVHKQNIQTANNKFFNRYVRICFQNWAYYHLYSNKMIRVSKATLKKKVEKQMKEKYFIALIRAYENSLSATKFYKNSLERQVINNLKQRIQFIALKGQIKIITDGKRQVNLQKKVFSGLKTHTNRKQQLKSMQSVLVQKHRAQLERTVIWSLRQYLDSKITKAQNLDFIDKLYLIRLQKSVFYKLHQNYAREKENLMKFEVVKEQRENYLVQKYFIEMLIKYNKRIIQKHNAEIIIKKRQSIYKYKTWTIWLRRYRDISHAEFIICQKIQANVTHDIFKLWRFRYLMQKEFNFKKHLYDSKVKARNTKVMFFALKSQIEYQAHKSKLKNIGQYFRLGAKAGNCLIELKKYAQHSRLKREVPVLMHQRKVERIFENMKWNWIRKIKSNSLLEVRNENLKVKVFQNLFQYSNLKISNRNIIQNFTNQREYDIKEQVFKVLVCPEFYMCKEPREFEQHEHFKVKFVLQNWMIHTKKCIRLKQASDQIKSKIDAELKKNFLKKWRTSLYMQDIISQVAIPFFENTIELSVKRRTFMSLTDYLSRSKSKKENSQSSKNFFEQGLQIKALEIIRTHTNKKIEKKLLIKYQTVKRAQRYVLQSFNGWKQYHAFKSELKQKSEIIKKISISKIEQRIFKLWHHQHNEENILEPANQMTIELFQKNIKKKVYKALYNNRTNELIQKTMKKTSEFYHTESVRRKAFNSLAWYALQHKRRKNCLSDLADIHYKRRFINLWVKVLNQTHSLKERIITQHHDSISDVQKLIGEFQDGVKVHNFQTAHTIQSMGSLPPRSQKPQQQLPNIISSLNLQDLNTSEDLKQAHDLLTQQLQTMLQSNSFQSSKDKEILKNMISQVKLKYQSKRGLLTDGQQMHLKIQIQEQEEALSDAAASDRLEDIEYLKAIELYKTNIFKKTFSSFKIYAQNNGKNEVEYIQAQAFLKLKRKHRVFKGLQSHKNEKQRLNQIHMQIAIMSETGMRLMCINALVQNIKNKQEKRGKIIEAKAHYDDRLIRLGLFAFKKQQLITMMMKSISIKIEERVTGEYWQAWKGIFQNRLSSKRSNKQLEVPTERDDLSDDVPEEHKKSIRSSHSQIMMDYNFDLEEMEDQIKLVPQESVEDKGFNDTYGTRFSGAQVLDEMALDFEDNPTPFDGFDNLKIEQNESLVSDSFENMFHSEEKKTELRKMEQQKNETKQRSDISLLLEDDEVPYNVDSSHEITTDMKIVGQRTGSDYKRYDSLQNENDMINQSGSEYDF